MPVTLVPHDKNKTAQYDVGSQKTQSQPMPQSKVFNLGRHRLVLDFAMLLTASFNAVGQSSDSTVVMMHVMKLRFVWDDSCYSSVTCTHINMSTLSHTLRQCIYQDSNCRYISVDKLGNPQRHIILYTQVIMYIYA